MSAYIVRLTGTCVVHVRDAMNADDARKLAAPAVVMAQRSASFDVAVIPLEDWQKWYGIDLENISDNVDVVI